VKLWGTEVAVLQCFAISSSSSKAGKMEIYRGEENDLSHLHKGGASNATTHKKKKGLMARPANGASVVKQQQKTTGRRRALGDISNSNAFTGGKKQQTVPRLSLTTATPVKIFQKEQKKRKNDEEEEDSDSDFEFDTCNRRGPSVSPEYDPGDDAVKIDIWCKSPKKKTKNAQEALMDEVLNIKAPLLDEEDNQDEITAFLADLEF